MSCPPNTTGPAIVWTAQEQSGNLADSIGAFEAEFIPGPLSDEQVEALLAARGWTIGWTT